MPDRESTRKERVKGPEDVEPEQSVSQGRREWRGGSPGPVDMGLSPGGEGKIGGMGARRAYVPLRHSRDTPWA